MTHAGTDGVQHTPGPWTVREEEDRDGVSEFEIDAHTWVALAVVYGNEYDRMNEQGRANANLIAAAPEMLAALRLSYPLLTDKAAKEEVGALLNRIEAISPATNSEPA